MMARTSWLPGNGPMIRLALKTSAALLALSALAVSTPAQVATWFADIALKAPGKVGGCAIGDLDPDHPGNEVVAVCETGEVFLCRPYGRRWVAERLATGPGELIQCAIGDFDPIHEGNEVLAVGMKSGREDDSGPGAAYMIAHTEEGWAIELLVEDSALLHAVCIADLDPSRPGDEAYIGGFGERVFALSRAADSDSGSTWTADPIAELEGPVKSLARRAGSLLVATASGSLSECTRAADASAGWTVRERFRSEVGLARLAVLDDRVLAACDDGRLRLFEPANDDADASFTASVLHAEDQKLRGAVIADLDPDVPGFETATCGYERRLSVLYDAEDEWIAQTVYTDRERFHHLAVGELVEASAGPEIVACGYSGFVICAGVETR